MNDEEIAKLLSHPREIAKSIRQGARIKAIENNCENSQLCV